MESILSIFAKEKQSEEYGGNTMFWDKVAWIYDLFANVINRKANKALCIAVEEQISPHDDVLECACGTGLLTGVLAAHCKSLITTDFSVKMLKCAEKKYRKYGNVRFEQENILRLSYPDECFDTVVAANVIHLLDEPYQALHELERVCKYKGKIIIPTYMNQTDKGKINGISGLISKAGANFKREFTIDTYKHFFIDAGYEDASYILCKGRIPCVVAILTNSKKIYSFQ